MVNYTMLLVILVPLALVGARSVTMPDVMMQLIERGAEYEDSRSSNRYHASCVLVYSSSSLCSMGEPVPATFFGEEKVHAGETISAYFPRASPPRLGFLRRHVAETIPFSAANFTKILDHLGIAAGSEEAVNMLSTLRFCDSPPHHSYCVTSYEDMVERAANLLGTPDVRAMASVLPRDGASLQPYTVRGVKTVDGSELVACHAKLYPYGVYIFHKNTHASVTIRVSV